jgi:hypothetical protein
MVTKLAPKAQCFKPRDGSSLCELCIARSRLVRALPEASHATLPAHGAWHAWRVQGDLTHGAANEGFAGAGRDRDRKGKVFQ